MQAFYIFLAIFFFGIMILVHEFGHFITAKVLRVPVEVFSIGFGPFILSFQTKKTKYGIAAFPFGGYVKPVGMDAREKMLIEDEEKKFNFKLQPFWKRLLIGLAGAFLNIVFALFLFVVVFVIGVPSKPTTTIEQVMPKSPAKKAGFKERDRILKIDGKPVSRWEQVLKVIHSNPNKVVKFDIKRGTKTVVLRPQLSTTPSEVRKQMAGESKNIGYLGISSKLLIERQGFFGALSRGVEETGIIIGGFFQALYLIIRGKIAWRPVSPVGFVQATSQAAEFGWTNFFWIISLFSILIGITNLLPIPPLDGGRIVLWAIESIKKKPFSDKVVLAIQAVGVALIVVIAVQAFYLDIFHPLQFFRR